jgi:hypothetical protein
LSAAGSVSTMSQARESLNGLRTESISSVFKVDFEKLEYSVPKL